ncbi:MAG: MFS transporter [Bacilli bacterium]|nr:MFS transporter [Bacilli bacterium]MBO4682310.1 MFS transporter [Bacilli bacterium]
MKRLTKKQMIIFAIGQLGWSTLSGVITTWLVTFYLPTAGDIEQGAVQYLVPGLVIGGFMTVLGLISALGRVFDAVTDPLIASLSDRSKNPRGRRTPFMQIAALPLSVVTVLVFCPFWGEQSPLNIMWVSIMLVLFYLFMTMYCTPYNSLISEYGKTQEDRMFISTAISLTFFVGTLLAYVPFVLAGALRGAGLSFAWSYRVPFIVLAVIALVSMLLPTFLLKEKEFVDTKPSEVNVFKSLGATFKNRDFRVFVGSDVMYWVGLTMFQTGLPFFVKVSMGLGEDTVLYFLGGMTVLSVVFYPFVTKLVKKFGKKKLVIGGFLGLSLAYAIAACTYFVQGQGGVMGWLLGIAIVIVAAFPMALLGIIPQSIVADVAEAEGVVTGENREGMFFAARTFAMKFGQSLALILFTSLAIIGTTQNKEANDIVPSLIGMLVVAIVAIAFCVLGAVILFFYREKHIMKTIAKEGDEAFMQAVEANNKEEKE